LQTWLLSDQNEALFVCGGFNPHSFPLDQSAVPEGAFVGQVVRLRAERLLHITNFLQEGVVIPNNQPVKLGRSHDLSRSYKLQPYGVSTFWTSQLSSLYQFYYSTLPPLMVNAAPRAAPVLPLAATVGPRLALTQRCGAGSRLSMSTDRA